MDAMGIVRQGVQIRVYGNVIQNVWLGVLLIVLNSARVIVEIHAMAVVLVDAQKANMPKKY